MSANIFPLVAGFGTLAIAYNISNPKENYEDYRVSPGYEHRLGMGNDHIDVSYSQRLATYLDMTGDPQRYHNFLDLHNTFRRLYNKDEADNDAGEVTYYESRMERGIIGEYALRSTADNY